MKTKIDAQKIIIEAIRESEIRRLHALAQTYDANGCWLAAQMIRKMIMERKAA